MKAKIKGRWIAALRSGRYRQAKQRLKSKYGAYCCLGVLCNITGAKWVKDDGDLYPFLDGKKLSPRSGRHILSQDTLRHFGITKKQQEYLAALNDGREADWNNERVVRHPFKKIADYIEKNL